MELERMSTQLQSLALSLAVAIIGVLAAPVATAQDASNEADDEAIEEVVVKGIRGGLQRSIDTKRNATNIVDALSAHDIGDFPDKNVAEALQRIPGVAIDRTTGEGAFVSLRGLGPEFVRVTLNGRTATSNVPGERSFRFDQVQAEVVEMLEVNKSPQADLVEGGLAGTINVKTRRPLDLGSRQIALSALANYNSLADNVDPRVFGLFSDTFADDTFGFLIAASLDDRSIREDNVDVPDYQIRSFDLDGDGTNEVSGWFPGNVRAFMLEQDRRRVNVNTSLQWAASPDLDAVVDVVYSNFELGSLTNGLPFRTQAGIGGNATEVISDGGVISFFETTGARPRADVTDVSTESEQVSIGANIEYRMSERWNLTADLSHTSTEVDSTDRRVFYDVGPALATYDIRSGALIPEVTLDEELTDPAGFTHGILENGDNFSEDEELQFRLDLDYALEGSFFSGVKFGFSYRDRKFANDGNGTGFITDFRGEPLTDISYGLLGASDFLGGLATPGWPTSWVAPDINSAFDQLFYGRMNEIDPGILDPDHLEEPQSDYEVDEDSSAAYVMVNFDTRDTADTPVWGNFGVRVVRLERTTTGNVVPIIGFEVPNGGTSPVFIFGDSTAESFDASNTEVLPSLNLTVGLKEDLLLRFGGGKVITEPAFGDLSPGTLSANASTRSIVSGNPNLDPLTAWQADVSLEWYMNDSSIISVGGFAKWVDSFINVVSTVEEFIDPDTGLPIPDPDDPTINVTLSRTAPRNEDGAFIGGLEFNLHQTFDFLPAPWDGLGAMFNYTYISTDAEFINPNNGASFDVPGLSDKTFNLGAFYEKGPISVKLVYNQRGEFLNNISDLRGNPRFTGEFTQLDASVRYQVSDVVTVTFDAVNLTDENREDFNKVGDTNVELLRFSNNTGPRYFAGVSVKF